MPFKTLGWLAALAVVTSSASAQRVPSSADTTASMTTLVPGTFVKFAGDAGELAVYRVEVPAGQKRLSISTRGQRGNVDLYLVDESVTDFGRRPPSRAVLADRAIDFTEGPTSRETLTVFRPAAGTHYAIVRAADDARNIRVSAWVVSRPGREFTPVLPAGQTVLMTSSRGSSLEDCLELAVNVPAGSESMDVFTWGGSGTLWLAENGATSSTGTGTTRRFTDVQPRSGERVLQFCEQLSYRNVRLRVELDSLPKVAVGGEVAIVFDRDDSWHGGPVGHRGSPVPGVVFENRGTREVTDVVATRMTLNGAELPLATQDPIDVGALSSGSVKPRRMIPVPLSTGMTGNFEIDVLFTDFRGRTWTRTFTGQLTAP